MRKNDRRVVITGLGIVAPTGIGHEALWRAVHDGHNAVAQITRFDASAYQCRVAGEVPKFEAADFIDPHVIKQTDRMTHLAMAACALAVRDAGLDLAQVDRRRVGMIFANVFGGMEFAERELFAQTFLSPARVSAYQAIAWFYAASQGQWSIASGVRGYGKSIVADRAGGLQALLLGALAIRQGQCDFVLAGGAEAPLAPYVYAIHEAAGLLASGDAASIFRPFDRRACGMVLAEGAAILLLESLDGARRRGAPIYAELAGGATNIDSQEQEATGSPDALAVCLELALADADLVPDDVTHVLPEGSALGSEDAREARALRLLFAGRDEMPSTSVPKTLFGHMLAAAGPADAALAARMLREGSSAIAPLPSQPIDDMFLSARSSTAPANAALCCSRGFQGINAAIALRREENMA